MTMRPIPEFPDYYACSDGVIWSGKANKLLKATDDWEEGYIPLLSMNDVREISLYVADGVPDQKIAHWYCIPVWSVQPVSWYEPGSYRLLVMTGSDFLEADGESAVA